MSESSFSKRTVPYDRDDAEETVKALMPQSPSYPGESNDSTDIQQPRYSLQQQEQVERLDGEHNGVSSQRDDEDSMHLDYGETESPPANDGGELSIMRRFYKIRHTVGAMVNHPTVQLWIVILIIINAIIMGIATFDFVTDNPKVESIFEKIDKGFLVVFTIELVMQIIYRGITLFTDGWLTFDFFIVVLSWAFESLQIIRAFRIFRALRLVTRVRQLRDLVLALGAVLPRMNAIAALLMLIFYIFAVLFTELFKHLDLSSNYFKTLDASLLTCVELMTLEWAGIVREVMSYYDWAWLPFLAFINITGFIVFNLIVAVVCDAVSVVERQNNESEDNCENDDAEEERTIRQERINNLGRHVMEMMDTQNEMQDLLRCLASDMAQIKETPPENGYN